MRGCLHRLWRSLFLRQTTVRHVAATRRGARPLVESLELRDQPAVSLGAAGQFAVLGINGGNVTLNSSTISGPAANIGLGPNETSKLQKTSDNGNLIVDPTAHADLSKINKNFTITGAVLTQSLAQANADANSASAAFDMLAPTQTLGKVTQSLTLTGNGGLNVIRMTSLNFKKDTLTLAGGANDEFVINISGNFSFGKSVIQLTGGVTPNHVLFNFNNKGDTVDFSNDDSIINGTVLAPYRTVTYKNPAVFNGSIIAKTIDITAKGSLTYVPFAPPAPPPASFTPASIGGFVIDTSNGLGVPHATITLIGTDINGHAVNLTADTDDDGFYQFTNVVPGTYKLVGGAPIGYSVASTSLGTVDGSPSGSDNTTDITNIVLGSGSVGTNYDFLEDRINVGGS